MTVQMTKDDRVAQVQSMGNRVARWGGMTALAGAVSMFMGAALWGASGADIWTSLAADDLAPFLQAAGQAKGLLVANTTFWIIGVLLMGVAGAMMGHLCHRRPQLAQVAQVCFRTAVPLAIVSFLTMLSLAVQIGGDASETTIAIARVVGWIGARTDDLATILIVGAGPVFLALAGRGEWMPTWLARWAYLAGLTGWLALLALYNPSLAALSFVIIPIGLGWMIAAGIIMLRQSPQG